MKAPSMGSRATSRALNSAFVIISSTLLGP
jgi:hypothetical protein